ncbi:nitroreductase [Cesiribacter sp. SM1]|uniref:nitroreductase family protein n=1 Tax=Cesiribacter sp. SM1 TaxID=2861196 RepID=UPI001CD7AA39|nr:nitroreductase [Cesiribacter sp. SM1]
MKKFDTQEINHLISYRRAVYPVSFSGERIDDAVIEQLLENANWAPTHALTEPWRFTVFTETGLQKLANFQADLYKQFAMEEGSYVESKHQKLLDTPLMCSHVISIGLKRDPKGKVPEIEEVEAVACAVQNMWLTAAAYGIGCYWGSGGITYRLEALSFFGLEPNDKLLGFLYLGIPKNDWPAGRRSPIADKVRWVKE